jgi:putative peptide zinc metalloprotease protein
MLCTRCRRQVARGTTVCPACGEGANDSAATFDLILADRTRVRLTASVTIGRASDNTVRLDDPSVSRHHAQVMPGPHPGDPPRVVDVGSRFGTWVDGRRLNGPEALHDGARLRVGDQRLLVERRRRDHEAGLTFVVPAGASLIQHSLDSPSASVSERPRLRSGYALKRLPASEGSRRWILRDLVGEKFLRLGDDDATLLDLLDGQRSLADLVRESEARFGDTGPARLARLLSELGSRGLLAGSQDPGTDLPAGPLQRLFVPRATAWHGAGGWFERLYADGGWILFGRAVLASVTLVAVVGIAVYAYLVAARYGTPFVVASKVGLGGLVFVLGRAALVTAHETAHGLTLASFGRRVQKAGLKLVLVFPYAYVDTSEAWFEPRRRRIAVSAAGPVSDLAFGGTFAIACLSLPAGTARDILFQLAFAAYLGALFNLNPLLERDGYQVLSDLLGEPALRRHALAQLRRRLAGDRQETDSRVLTRYAYWVLAWLAVAAVFAVGMSIRYESALAAFVPTPVAWALLAIVWLSFFTPILALTLPSLRGRRNARGG